MRLVYLMLAAAGMPATTPTPRSMGPVGGTAPPALPDPLERQGPTLSEADWVSPVTGPTGVREVWRSPRAPEKVEARAKGKAQRKARRAQRGRR